MFIYIFLLATIISLNMFFIMCHEKEKFKHKTKEYVGMILIIFTERKLSTGYMIVPVAVKDKRTDLIYVMSDSDVFFF